MFLNFFFLFFFFIPVQKEDSFFLSNYYMMIRFLNDKILPSYSSRDKIPSSTNFRRERFLFLFATKDRKIFQLQDFILSIIRHVKFLRIPKIPKSFNCKIRSKIQNSFSINHETLELLQEADLKLSSQKYPIPISISQKETPPSILPPSIRSVNIYPKPANWEDQLRRN